MSRFRRRKTRWQRFQERMSPAVAKHKVPGKRALGVASGAAGLVAASAATSSRRGGRRAGG